MISRRISHIEISAKSPDNLAKFYVEMFGWEARNMDNPSGKYTVWQSSNMRGGFAPIGDENKQGDVTVYLDSDDIDADLKKVEINGGKILKGKTEYPGGWFAYFEDPSGNRLGLTTLVMRN
ncbi:MAG TPA: VOC family protein [Candidatus Paceibacterota bacterium]|nr:VOC family protein [Candidatus Paceibacterota bacterium]